MGMGMARGGLLLALAGCADVAVTPRALLDGDGTTAVPAAEREATLARWREAVALANEFLASSWRRTLPTGRFELDDERGMTFTTPDGGWPIELRCTTWGDLCVASGFAAQERDGGFVVGAAGRERDRRVDNSLFVDESGFDRAPEGIAELLLHETTHVVWREGTVGFWNGFAYYLEAIFLLRAIEHSAERKAYATTHEFDWFTWTRQNPLLAADPSFQAMVESHSAQDRPDCHHGPFEERPPEPPLPRR